MRLVENQSGRSLLVCALTVFGQRHHVARRVGDCSKYTAVLGRQVAAVDFARGRPEVGISGSRDHCNDQAAGDAAPAMIDRTTSLGVGCYRGGQVCKPGGRPYADAHDFLLAENVIRAPA